MVLKAYIPASHNTHLLQGCIAMLFKKLTIATFKSRLGKDGGKYHLHSSHMHAPTS